MSEAENLKIELIKNEAIQDYLLTRGSNYEEINTRIFDIRAKIIEIQKEQNQ